MLFDIDHIKGKPKAELVICKDFNETGTLLQGKPSMRFDKVAIYAVEPLRYDYIYVDALNGKILLSNPIIVDIDGIAATRYSGTKTITTTKNASNVYVLKDWGTV